MLTRPQLRGFDAIGVYLTGSKISDFRLALDLLPEGKRPLLFCGFNESCREISRRHELAPRLRPDQLSGPRDRDAFERMIQHTPFAQQRSVMVGPRCNETSTQGLSDERPKQFLFAEQVVMPSSPEDRAEMVRILRSGPTLAGLAGVDQTTHRARRVDIPCPDLHISETLRQSIGQPPENLNRLPADAGTPPNVKDHGHDFIDGIL